MFPDGSRVQVKLPNHSTNGLCGTVASSHDAYRKVTLDKDMEDNFKTVHWLHCNELEECESHQK